MYATYQYAAGSTAANILADVVAILTGTTNKATLSANCVQAGTEILTTYSVAGWEMFDNAAGANFKVLRAPWHTDNGVGYNYVGIDTNFAGYIHVRVFESWNAATHVGTNECQNDSTAGNSQRYNTAAGGSLYISANAGHSCFMFSFQSGIWGNSTASSPSGMFERTRRSAWDTNANAYPVAIWGSSNSSSAGVLTLGASPRYVGASGVDVTAGSALIYSSTPMTSMWNATSGYGASTSMIPNADKVPQHLFVPIAAVHFAAGFFGGNCSKYTEIYQTTNGYGSSLDEVIKGGQSFVVWATAGSYRLAIRKG